ncbi:hypothetical protein QOZ80_7BG0608780 [Eleusine coracana subsp. coracana]|nr:hypothetical protein QOZ80_7BG0608780 [Eleusine coracana subsp. coracana]
MMEEGTADLLELVRLPDVLVVCSSTGWTDEKHMLYLRLLEESFISQLQAGECHYKGLLNHSSRSCMHIESSKQIVKCEYADQGGLEISEGDQAKSCINAEHVASPSSSGSQKDEVHSMDEDDDASTSEPVEEASHQIRATNSGQSSKCSSGKHRHSPSRSAEGSDQNFAAETKGIGGSRGCNQKRLKSADDKMNDQVVPCTKAEFQQVGCTTASDKDAGLLNGGVGAPSCKDHGPTG